MARTSTTWPTSPSLAKLAAKRLADRRTGLPLAVYRDDPVGFARDVLGLTVWDRQAEILESIRDHASVAVRSGHKIGKSTGAVSAALWFVSTRPRARVVLTSSSDDQIRNILWKELARVHEPVKDRVGGNRALDHRTGLRFPDGREIIGLATKKPENMAGLSGPEMLFIADEASGIDEAIFEAIEGNRAAGAKLALFSNPTRTSGKFFDAFHAGRAFWKCIHVSSEAAAEAGIPGLATKDYVASRKQEWGVDSPLYQVRIEGNFASQAENSVLGLAILEDARKRYDTTEAKGRLNLGVDVARFGDDDSVIAPRRGNKIFPLVVVHGMDTMQVAAKVLDTARRMREMHERARVKVDTIGVGGGVADILRTNHSDELEVVDINSSSASDEPEEYFNLRTQMSFGIATFLKEGGTIPEDSQLEAELVSPIYTFDGKGRRKVESKDDIKKRLKRSPDKADAVALAIYSSSSTPIRPPTQKQPTYRLGSGRGF